MGTELPTVPVLTLPGFLTRVARILDVRPEAEFVLGHAPDAASIPLEALPLRVHELPPRGTAFCVYDAQSVRARWAVSRLRARGFEAVSVLPDELVQRAAWVTGPPRAVLWRPHAFLVEAWERIVAAGDLPEAPRAADLACGTGRDAVCLAASGCAVDAYDALPDALSRADNMARRCGVHLRTICADLEAPAPLPRNAYDAVTVFNFLHRPLMEAICMAVRPGGYVVYETFVDPQIERVGKPRRREHVLRTGELRELFKHWRILVYREAQTNPRRYAAGLVARRPAAGG